MGVRRVLHPAGSSGLVHILLVSASWLWASNASKAPFEFEVRPPNRLLLSSPACSAVASMRLKGQRPTGVAPGAASPGRPSAFAAAAAAGVGAAAAPAAAPAVVRLPGYGAWLKDGRPKPLKVGCRLGLGSVPIVHQPWQAPIKWPRSSMSFRCGATLRAGV